MMTIKNASFLVERETVEWKGPSRVCRCECFRLSWWGRNLEVNWLPYLGTKEFQGRLKNQFHHFWSRG